MSPEIGKRTMGADMLAEIIEVEREIRERLAAERELAGEELAALRSEAEAELARETALLEEELARAVAEARRNAEAKGVAMTGEAARRAEQLALLDDDTLQRLILRHLRGILPGACHDSKDVEG